MARVIWSRFIANRPTSAIVNSSSLPFLIAADLLIRPDDLIEREGDLLLGLELDDVGDPLLLDRGQLDELDQPSLTRNCDGNLASLDVVAIGEGRERLANQLLGVGIRLAEDLGVFDEVERLGHEPRRDWVREPA